MHENQNTNFRSENRTKYTENIITYYDLNEYGRKEAFRKKMNNDCAITDCESRQVEFFYDH